MKFKRFVSCILAVLMFIPTFAACSKDKEGEEENNKSVLISDGVALHDYKLVYPDKAEQETADVAYDLQNLIEKATGVKLEVISDFEREGTEFQRTDYEILVGETNRDESIALEGMLYRDFAVTWQSTRIAVYGQSLEALQKAADWFAQNCLDAEKGIMAVETSLDYRFAFDYALTTFTLFGKTVEAFEICAPADGKDAACVLQEAIANLCGVRLPVVTKQTEGKYAIMLDSGATDETLAYNEYSLVGLDGGSCALVGGSEYLIDADMLVNAFLNGVLHYDAQSKTTSLTNGVLEINTALKGNIEMSNLGFEVADAAFLENYENQATEMRNKILGAENTVDPSVWSGTVYYVSSTDGDDGNSGTSPDKAWKTLTNVNTKTLARGSAVLFKRGDIFRGGIRAQAGVTYSSYGTGEKPRIYGSPEDGTGAEKWTLLEGTTNIWVYYKELCDVGQIIFNGGSSWAQRVYYGYNVEEGYATVYNKTERLDIKTALDQNLKFWHCPEKIKDANGVPQYTTGKLTDFENTAVLYLRCDEGNPGELYSEIEFCTLAYNTQPYTYGHIIAVGGKADNVTVDNLCLRYGSAHGVGGGDCTGLTVKNCEIGWIGGAVQYLVSWERYKTCVFGNGIEVVRTCQNFTVKNNWIYQCYDDAITNQSSYTEQTASQRVVENIEYVENLIEYCGIGISTWLTGNVSAENTPAIKNILIEGNFFRFTGCNCHYESRPNKKVLGALVTSWGGYGLNNRFENCVIRNNIFDRTSADEQLLIVTVGKTEWLPKYEGNTFIQYYGCKFGYSSAKTADDLTYQWAPYFSKANFDLNIANYIKSALNDSKATVAIAFK